MHLAARTADAMRPVPRIRLTWRAARLLSVVLGVLPAACTQSADPPCERSVSSDDYVYLMGHCELTEVRIPRHGAVRLTDSEGQISCLSREAFDALGARQRMGCSLTRFVQE